MNGLRAGWLGGLKLKGECAASGLRAFGRPAGWQGIQRRGADLHGVVRSAWPLSASAAHRLPAQTVFHQVLAQPISVVHHRALFAGAVEELAPRLRQWSRVSANADDRSKLHAVEKIQRGHQVGPEQRFQIDGIDSVGAWRGGAGTLPQPAQALNFRIDQCC